MATSVVSNPFQVYGGRLKVTAGSQAGTISAGGQVAFSTGRWVLSMDFHATNGNPGEIIRCGYATRSADRDDPYMCLKNGAGSASRNYDCEWYNLDET